MRALKLFGFEFRKIPKEPTYEEEVEEMCVLAQQLTDIWAKMRKNGRKERPWIEWDDKQVIITVPQYNYVRKNS